MKISTSIAVSRGEALKLSESLESLKGFADEIVVFNLGEDEIKLRELQTTYKFRVVSDKPTDYVETVRNKMITEASGDWILILDPDERLSEPLKRELLKVTEGQEFDAVNIPRKNIFFSRWVAHTNWWPDRLVRFFRNGKVRWESKIHSYPKVLGRTLNLPAREELAILHYGYNSVSEFIERQNRYSEVEAENRFTSGERFSWAKFLWWPTREFLARYIRHFGFLDGVLGFELSTLMVFYKFMVLVKLWEKENV